MNKTFELLRLDGSSVSKEFNQTIYTPHHLASLLEKAGFIIEHIYGDFDGSPINFASQKIVIVARK